MNRMDEVHRLKPAAGDVSARSASIVNEKTWNGRKKDPRYAVITSESVLTVHTLSSPRYNFCTSLF